GGVEVHYDKHLVEIDHRSKPGIVLAKFEDGTSAEGDILIGCDGIHSTVRKSLFGHEKPSYTGHVCTIGIAPEPAESTQDERNALRIVYGQGNYFGQYSIDRQGNCVWFFVQPEKVEEVESWKQN